MKRKFRRKDYIVEAEEVSDGSWVVFDCNSRIYMTAKDFEKRFEEVSPLYRTSPLHLSLAEGAD